MRFAADRMLGKLAKWLRLLGYDTLYSDRVSDEEFLAYADSGRMLLTRNTRMASHTEGDRLLFIEGDDPKVQLQQVVHTLGLKPGSESFFTRCTICNDVLVQVEAEDVVGRVPDYVWSDRDTFSECKTCGKVYWRGTHSAQSREEMRTLLGV